MHKRLAANQKLIINLGCLALLALITITITTLYISSEYNFHWWIDWYSTTIQVAAAFRESPTEAIEFVQQSLVRERNRLFTLPLVPFILIFGDSRLVYEIGLALVYLLPLTLVMGAIATQLIPVHRQIVFWSTAALTLLLPVSWISTFIGIPDTGGPVFIGLAAFIYLQDVKLKQWWRIPAIGFFIGLSVLLRRHFVYGGIAFLAALSLQAAIFLAREIWQKRQIPWRSFSATTIKLSLISAIAFATIMGIAPEFTNKALQLDYKTLYTSWSLPLPDIITLYGAYYGWITWLMVAIGFSASILTRAVSVPTATLISFWGIFSLIIWLFILRYGNVFYSLHITPFVIIGIAAFLWTTWTRLTGKTRTIILSIASCYLVANLAIGIMPIGNISRLFYPLFAVNMPPLVRTDYDEIARLVNYLRQLAPEDEPIYIVGFQRIQLSPGVISAAERILYGRQGRILNILPSPQVDSRDDYPIETLLQAQYVVIPNPLPDYSSNPTEIPVVGEWLPNQELDVVQVVFDAFTQNWEIAQDFQRLPIQFNLEKGAVATIYQRIRPTSISTAVRTLTAMQQQIGEPRPGGQRDWIALNQPLDESFASKNTNNTYRLVAFKQDRDRHLSQLIPNKSPLFQAATPVQTTTTLPDLLQNSQNLGKSFLYIGSLPEKAEVKGQVTYLDKPCTSVSLRLAMLNQNGKIIGTTEAEYFPKNSATFQLPIQGKDPAYLTLDVVSNAQKDKINTCTLVLNSLTVYPAKLP